MLGVFVALAFVPLAVEGLLTDFARGLREAAPGSAYNSLTPRSLVTRMADQALDLPRLPAVAAVAALLAIFVVPGRRRLR